MKCGCLSTIPNSQNFSAQIVLWNITVYDMNSGQQIR